MKVALACRVLGILPDRIRVLLRMHANISSTHPRSPAHPHPLT